MTEAAIYGDILERNRGFTVSGGPPQKSAGLGGGAFEGADKIGREMASWSPIISSADGVLARGDKILLDGRARDMVRNHGPMLGAMRFHENSIVGHQYRLNSTPSWRYLGLSEAWAEEFQLEVEEKFNLYAESDDFWVDVDRTKTLTDIVRLSVCTFFTGGESVATINWMPGAGRPFATAVQMIDADRVSNPNDEADSLFLRRGVRLDKNGARQGLYIRRAHPKDFTAAERIYQWTYWPMWQKWGRLRTMHILDQLRPDQYRGVSEMVSVMKETRMGKRFHEVALANAIVQGSFAASIESELPPEMVGQMLGAGTGEDVGQTGASLSFLQAVAEYSRGARNLQIDGTKIPILFPGTKLKLTPASSSASGMGENLEQSFNRHVSTALGISYEEYTNDFSQTNYSSAKAASNNTLAFMKARKRKVADRTANSIYCPWLEEAITEGKLESTRQMTRRDPEWFYRDMNRTALCKATWIGASRGQVDEVKETNAAVLRIENGLSTVEEESARLGKDWRDVASQRAREMKVFAAYGLAEPSSGKMGAPAASFINEEEAPNAPAP